MKTIIYGGAFDPPHLAHEYIIRNLAEKYKPEQLYIVPSGARSDKVYKIGSKHRMRILSIFAENLSDIGAKLCDDFMIGRVPDGTTLGVDRFFRNHLGYSPTQVFGTDVIPNMKIWDPSGRVEREIPKIFVVRTGIEVPDVSGLDNFSTISPELPKTIAHLSSTGIRENIKKRIFSGLSSGIAEYIQQNNLYG